MEQTSHIGSVPDRSNRVGQRHLAASVSSII